MSFYEIEYGHKKFITDNSSLFEVEQFSDFTFIVGEEKFLVHKQILASKSSVFFAMFSSDMEESKKNQATIIDIDSKVFKELLRYVYTNSIQKSAVYAYELYKAADKYNIPNLKYLCADSMKSNVNINTAIKILSLADQYQDSSLITNMIEFMSKNIMRVVNSNEYKEWYPTASPTLQHRLLMQTISNIKKYSY